MVFSAPAGRIRRENIYGTADPIPVLSLMIIINNRRIPRGTELGPHTASVILDNGAGWCLHQER
jgi:hypothetical protein